MNSRRVSRPVRLTLATKLGSDIDGAWWPRTASVARELPELISTLRPRMGEVADIQINWSATEGACDLYAVALGAPDAVGLRRRPRVMRVSGARICVKLLVIPSMTSAELGGLVMRIAAGLTVPQPDQHKACLGSAQRALTAARAESADRFPTVA